MSSATRRGNNIYTGSEGKEKLSLCTNDMIIFVENPKESTQNSWNKADSSAISQGTW